MTAAGGPASKAGCKTNEWGWPPDGKVVRALVRGRRRSAPTGGGGPTGAGVENLKKKKSAIHGNRWRFTILGAYKRRWAPYVQAHGPGQGQLPLDRVWPQGLWFLS